MDVTPSPRILRMLGEIEFAEWQCIAELIDNALDDFTEIRRTGQTWPGGFKVSVTLPSSGASLEESEVVVQDTGRGMSRASLESAVRAGWSSNDRFDKLGLFGMGFNVSTARLGARTRVTTTRIGDPAWTGVEIDFDVISDDFEAKDLSESKPDLSEHGTRIQIGNLKRQHAEWLRRHPDQLRDFLGRVYSWILSTSPIQIWVGGIQVKPRIHCVWGAERYVTYGAGANAEQIPARINIDEVFEPADACALCGNWQDSGMAACRECGSNDLIQRERRLHGWLGIQRHLDKRDYGIDFLRNGRKILQSDKRIFDWTNPNDPVSGVITEYPVELAHQGGRIIGEIHLDHVPVTYSKNAFDYSDRGWRAAMDYLRGEGPLLPKNADRFGFDRNTSVTAKLIEGYRRTDAGRRSLIPGNGSEPIHETTREWARRFWAGDAEYQTDQKWWEAVESHEARKSSKKVEVATAESPIDADEQAVLAALGVSPNTVPEPLALSGPSVRQAVAVPPPASETSQERLERLTRESKPMPELSLNYGLPDMGVLAVSAYSVTESELLDELGEKTPVWVKIGAGRTVSAFFDSHHDTFNRFGTSFEDALLMELVPLLKVRSESKVSHSEIAARLRAACLADTAVDFYTIQNQARELIDEIKARMVDQVAVNPQRAVQYLSPDERTSIESGVVSEGSTFTNRVWEDGSFIIYAPALYLVKLLEGWPEAFMDDKVFRGPFADLASPSSQRMSVAKVVGYLNDLATVVTLQVKPSVSQLQRIRWSIGLLAEELTEAS